MPRLGSSGLKAGEHVTEVFSKIPQLTSRPMISRAATERRPRAAIDNSCSCTSRSKAGSSPVRRDRRTRV